MKRLLILCLFGIACLKPLDESVFTAGRYGTYYVAKTGDDANPGTKNKPWLTIRHAANTVVAGDLVLVGPGTYDEGDTMFFAGAAGTAAAPITFKSQAWRAATITTELYFKKPRYVIEGFRLLYSRRWASQMFKFDADSCAMLDCEVANNGATAGIGVLIGSGPRRGIVIDRCYVHGFMSHGIYAMGVDCKVTHNVVQDNDNHGIQAYQHFDSGEVAYNLTSGQHGHGIILQGVGNRVHHNISYKNGNAGIYLMSEQEGYCHDNDIYNNTCYANGFNIWLRGGPNSIRNNAFLGSVSGEIYVAVGATATIDYNCYWPDPYTFMYWWQANHLHYAEWLVASQQDTHSILAYQIFADTAAHDFHLQAGSPCLFAGDPATPPGVDFYGNPTPAVGQTRVSMGAVEWVNPLADRRKAKNIR